MIVVGEKSSEDSREHDECFIIPSTQMLLCPDCIYRIPDCGTEAEQGCPQCGATDGGPIEGCDDCGITREHGRSWWSEDPPSAQDPEVPADDISTNSSLFVVPHEQEGDPQQVPAEDPILRLLGLNTPAERSLSRSSSSSTVHPAGDSCMYSLRQRCPLSVCISNADTAF